LAKILLSSRVMQTITTIGVTLGFLLGIMSGFTAGNPWSVILWRACIFAVATGAMFRWWSSIAHVGVRETARERQQMAVQLDSDQP
jgi:hypothetical protein